MKRDIKQLEEEKQQVLQKISKLKTRVESIVCRRQLALNITTSSLIMKNG